MKLISTSKLIDLSFCSGNFCHYVGQAVKGRDEDGSDLFGCATYQHRKSLLGAPKLDKVEVVPEYIEKKTGIGFKVSSVIGFSSLTLFVGLVLGSAAMSVRRKWKARPANSVVSIRFSTIEEE